MSIKKPRKKKFKEREFVVDVPYEQGPGHDPEQVTKILTQIFKNNHNREVITRSLIATWIVEDSKRLIEYLELAFKSNKLDLVGLMLQSKSRIDIMNLLMEEKGFSKFFLESLGKDMVIQFLKED